MALDFKALSERIDRAQTIRRSGRVTQVVGLTVESEGPAVSVGHLCHIENLDSGAKVEAEVVGFRGNRLLLMPLGELAGITPGAVVTSTGDQLRIPVGEQLIGRTLNGLGRPLDNKGSIVCAQTRRINANPPSALSRPSIREPLLTGVRCIDITATCGKGQRLGVFADVETASGVLW